VEVADPEMRTNQFHECPNATPAELGRCERDYLDFEDGDVKVRSAPEIADFD